MKVLAGDIGGTHARLATFRVGKGRPRLLREREWPSQEQEGLLPIVEAYLAEEHGEEIEAACLAVAGPVEGGSCHLPNLDWTVDAAALERSTGITPVRLLNDFDAVGHGVLLLESDEVEVLQEGEADRSAPIALVGAGTGLGVGYVDPSVDPPRVYSSEGGHASFAPRTDEEWGLARHLARTYGRVSWERALSGRGLANVYTYLLESGSTHERSGIREEIAAAADPASVVSEHGLAGDDPLCESALGLFVRLYGALAGDVALTVGSRGGVFVAGGIAPKILPALRAGDFVEAFRDKGRMRAYMEAIPVKIVLQKDVGLRGAARAAALVRAD